MNQVYEKLMKCYESVRKKVDFVPKVALVLGSGLGDYGDSIQIEQVLDYHDIDGFPVSKDIRVVFYSDMWKMCRLSLCKEEFTIMKDIRSVTWFFRRV